MNVGQTVVGNCPSPHTCDVAESRVSVPAESCSSGLGRMQPSLLHYHVLVVEDTPCVAELIEHILTSAGCRVTVAETGAEASQVIFAQPVDLVLLDVDLPDTTGYELCRQWQAVFLDRSLEVVFCTSRPPGEVIQQTKALGARGFVSKPFEPESLVRSVRATIKQSTAAR